MPAFETLAQRFVVTHVHAMQLNTKASWAAVKDLLSVKHQRAAVSTQRAAIASQLTAQGT